MRHFNLNPTQNNSGNKTVRTDLVTVVAVENEMLLKNEREKNNFSHFKIKVVDFLCLIIFF